MPQVVADTGAKGVFVLARSGDDLSTDVTVAYSVKGSARNGSAYKRLSGVKTIKAGKDHVSIKIKPLGRAGGPGAKSKVVLVLEADPAYTVGAEGKVKVKILGH